ncbi:MAG: transglycosylase SLT domain-containing protein [Gammaproteobacteria bacterium]
MDPIDGLEIVPSHRPGKLACCALFISLIWCAFGSAANAGEQKALRVAKIAHHEKIHIHRDIDVEVQMLKDAAAGIGRPIQWVELQTPFDLRQSLLQRTADIYLSPLPLVTDEKLNDASIAALDPIGFERYRLIGAAEDDLSEPAKLAHRKVAVKFSSPALPYLRQLKSTVPGLSIVVLPDQMPRDELLRKVQRGTFDAAVIATNYRTDNLAKTAELKYQFDITSMHPVSWKVHADNTQLIAQINKFLQRYHASYIEDSVQKAVADDGVVRAIAELGKNYLVENGQPVGFEYDLIKRFAKQNNLRLDIIVARDKQQANRWLKSGIGDIAMSRVVADLPELTENFSLSREYHHEIPVLLSRRSEEIVTLQQLHRKRIAVVSETHHGETLAEIDAAIDVITLETKAITAQAIDGLRSGAYDGLIVNANLVPKLLRANSDLSAGLSLPIKDHFRWAVRKGNPKLHTAVDDFLRQEYRSSEFNFLAERYAQGRTKQAKDRISPYDQLIKTYAEKYDFDWRLIAAQIYQESRFDPGAISHAGARGLMQIMPATALDLGLSNPEAPEASIHAGIKYLDELRNRFEDDVPQSERLWMALAAYNAGFERVRRARGLAVTMGLNPNRWFDNVEVAMRKMTQPDSPVQGCRCGQAIVYVRSIRSLYSAYRYVGSA